MLDAKKIKKDFPILSRKINGKTITYLDSAASTQKPKVVIQALTDFYENTYANVHRGIYTIAEEATEAYENCRAHLAKFLNAKSEKEIIFTRNATESVNLVAYTWGEKNVKKGDEIIVSILEHHSNLVPWQELCKRKNATLKVIPLDNDYNLDLKKYKSILSKKTKLVAVSGMSNVFGTIPNLKEIINQAHKFEAKVLVDGAQYAAHSKVDVQKLDCDFFVLSSHKMLGPTGVGALYGKEKLLEEMPPFLFGGEMISEVEQFSAKFNEPPWKFEAGTPNIADVVAFNTAITYLEKIGLEKIADHEEKLLQYAKKKFRKYKEVKLYTPKKYKNIGGVLSFTIKGIHPHDISSVFDQEGVCIRAGAHCVEPLMNALGIQATARMSFYLYNDFSDIDRAEKALKNVLKIFK